MGVLLFIIGEMLKLSIMGPVNMVLVPYMGIKFIFGSFRRSKSKNKMTEEEEANNKQLKLIKQVNKKGFFTNSTPVQIINKEHLGWGKIVKMDYDPEYYAPYDVDGRKLVLHVKFDGDSTFWFVNVEQLIK